MTSCGVMVLATLRLVEVPCEGVNVCRWKANGTDMHVSCPVHNVLIHEVPKPINTTYIQDCTNTLGEEIK